MYLKREYERIIFKLLNVCLLCLMMTHKYSQAKGGFKCIYGYEKSMYTANCTLDERETKFPKDLNRGIEALYLKRSMIRSIDDNTFENLSNIKFLFLEFNTRLRASARAFKPLNKLHTLDLSYSGITNTTAIEFPESLKQLSLSGVEKVTTESGELPISCLQDLEGLSLSDCSLNEVPSFGGPLISLTSLDLTDNALQDFKFESLANLCSLKKLFISPDVIEVRNYCECVKLKQWTESQHIIGANIICKSDNNDQECNTSLSKAFLETHNSCIRKRKMRTFLSWFFGVSIILAGCFVCVALLIGLYIACNRRQFSRNTIRAYFLCQRR
ncbi:uncharacterized protein LOC135842931 [Planococcus citri]|uniref:uncharacterized protein LOC135842931 n=1 Tax=Planococcus citri TaxID=170843 RepID=UPI0031F9E6A6